MHVKKIDCPEVRKLAGIIKRHPVSQEKHATIKRTFLIGLIRSNTNRTHAVTYR